MWCDAATTSQGWSLPLRERVGRVGPSVRPRSLGGGVARQVSALFVQGRATLPTPLSTCEIQGCWHFSDFEHGALFAKFSGDACTKRSDGVAGFNGRPRSAETLAVPRPRSLLHARMVVEHDGGSHDAVIPSARVSVVERVVEAILGGCFVAHAAIVDRAGAALPEDCLHVVWGCDRRGDRVR